MAKIMVVEHSMNETVPAPVYGPEGPSVSIKPWSLSAPPKLNATPAISSRVEAHPSALTLWVDKPLPDASPLAQLRHLLSCALPLACETAAKVQLSNSGLALDCEQIAAALASWTDDAIPVDSLIGFDFALRGNPPGTGSTGLAALIGQEVVAWPPEEALRLVAARLVVRLAHEILLNGPIIAQTEYPAPDTPRGKVTLVPRHVPSSIVQIRF